MERGFISLKKKKIVLGVAAGVLGMVLVVGGVLFFRTREMLASMGPTELTYTHEDHASAQNGSAVYMTTDISPAGLMAVYDALNWSPTGKVAVKLSTGEPPDSNYLDPDLIKDLVQRVGGTIVENNTAYGGSRSETAMHYQVAEDHGFTAIADVVILDENGSVSLPVAGRTRLSVDCDCNGNPAEPDMHDIGILASADPVALDQACVDLVYAAPDGQSLVNRMESRNAEQVLIHAEQIGLGSRSYQLVNLNA